MEDAANGVWQIDDRTARAAFGEGAVVIDLARPAEGLRIEGHGNQFDSSHLLGVELDDAQTAAQRSNLEFYSRHGDLVATYAETESRCTRVQVYWRLLPTDGVGITRSQSLVLAFELQISVQTSRLDAAPWQSTRSRIAANHPSRPIDQSPSLAQAACNFDSLPLQLHRPQGGCVILCPIAGGDACYAEMVHPADYQRTELNADHAGAVGWSHALLAGRLEKGVILRARVRGLLCRGVPAGRALSDAFESFVCAAPPLTV